MKKTGFILTAAFILMVLFYGRSASAINIDSCADLAELNQKWKTKYYYQLNVQNIPLVDLKCNDANYKIAKALNLLSEFTSQSLAFNFYDDIVSKAVRALVIATDFEGETNNRCASANIYSGRITLRDCYFQEDVYYRAGSLVHEARHLELGERGRHVTCQKGADSGTKNCDSEFSNDWDKAGAYSYEVLFYRNLYNNSKKYGFDTKSLKELINGNLELSFNKISPEFLQSYWVK